MNFFKKISIGILSLGFFCGFYYASAQSPQIVGYGKTKAVNPAFTISLSPDLWTNTTLTSFTVDGTISANSEVTPNFKIAYGVSPQNLSALYPASGSFFNSPLAVGDSGVDINPTHKSVSLSQFKDTIKDNSIYFALVDSKNTDIAYTDTQALSLGGNSNTTQFYVNTNDTKEAPSMSGTSGESLAGDICEGPKCQFKDLLGLFTKIWKFIIILIVPLVAIMSAWIGYNFMQSGSEYREEAKEMAMNLIKGLVLILFAWFIVKTILDFTVGKDSCYSFLGKGNVDPNCLSK